MRSSVKEGRMRILIVAYYFPPLNSIASLRPYSWAKWWTRMGHDVTVLTKDAEDNSTNFNLDCSEFNIIRVPFSPPFPLVVTKEKFSEIITGKLKKNFSVGQKISIFIKKTLNFIFFKFSATTGLFGQRFPSFIDIWEKEAEKIVVPSNYDILVSTSAPYSDHRIGLYFRSKGWNGKWIVDWRDLWTRNFVGKAFFLFRGHERKLEKKIHDKADYVTTVSQGLVDTLKEITNTPIKLIYNGFDTEEFGAVVNRPRKQNEKFTIAYIGSIYGGFRDPTPLFQAVKELTEEKHITSNMMEIVFAGKMSEPEIYGMSDSYGIREYISYKGLLPREEAIEIEYDADILLFLGTNDKGAMTGKIFEYLYLGRRIWAVGCNNKSECGELIEETNVGKCFEKDVNLLKEEIIKSMAQACNYPDKNWKKINMFTRRLQAEEMIKLVSS